MTLALTRREITAISHKLSDLCGDLMSMDMNDGKAYLQRLMDYIDETPILHTYITTLPIIEADTHFQNKDPFSRYPVYAKCEEQISFTYQLLQMILSDPGDYIELCFGYGHSNNINHHIYEFNKAVVQQFVVLLRRYLGDVMSGLPEEPAVPTINNFQQAFGNNISIANAQADSTAISTLTNGSSDELIKLITQALPLINEADINASSKEEAIELLDTIREQTLAEKPRKSIIKRCIEGLNEFATLVQTGTTLAGLLAAIVDKVQLVF